jgi:hypothetical protein
MRMANAPLISPEYAALNKQLHEERDDYGAGGRKDAPEIAGFCRNSGFKTILDFGCGKGVLKPAIAAIAPELTVLEFDPAVEGKDTLPAVPVDLVAALDVMEHIEPECLEGVLEAMRGMGPKCVLLVISLHAAQKTLPDGRNAHLIVKPAEWWVTRLGRYFSLFHRIDTPNHFTFIGTPLP